MEISYKVFEKKGFGKVPVIHFSGEQYTGLGDLLNIDFSSITLEDILYKINKIENGESEFEEIGTERSIVEIRKNECMIYDAFDGLLDDDELNPTINLSTLEFKKIVMDWKVEREKLLSTMKEL
ncbi:hypothetical protein RKK46_001187 [Listeria innocua]|uniref:hypothetical protein n=1 Tax=Listeria TaxID=1637 RepID=UPI0005EE3FA5|nr:MULTISPECIES: hypothetical protein [Listeria]EAE6207628.1 hypothetical protein [Listeria innocua]ECJ9438272.1 hypothetical protein [Listeria innocua]EEP3926412.1 hypothetical protein [Listeria innocua]EHE8322853.1 hypothetical protein [Listeria monocytogenes]EIX7075690.1 hypothetical protein [Listeria innocua]